MYVCMYACMYVCKKKILEDFHRFEETGELLAVLLPHVRRSIEAAQIEATNIIEMLEGEVGSTAPSVDRTLHRTLRQMPLSALLGLIMPRDDVFGALLEQEVEVLRCRLGWTWVAPCASTFLKPPQHVPWSYSWLVLGFNWHVSIHMYSYTFRMVRLEFVATGCSFRLVATASRCSNDSHWLNQLGHSQRFSYFLPNISLISLVVQTLAPIPGLRGSLVALSCGEGCRAGGQFAPLNVAQCASTFLKPPQHVPWSYISIEFVATGCSFRLVATASRCSNDSHWLNQLGHFEYSQRF